MKTGCEKNPPTTWVRKIVLELGPEALRARECWILWGRSCPQAVLAAIYVVTIWVLRYMPQGVRTALVSQAPIAALLILLRPFTGQAAPLTG